MLPLVIYVVDAEGFSENPFPALLPGIPFPLIECVGFVQIKCISGCLFSYRSIISNLLHVRASIHFSIQTFHHSCIFITFGAGDRSRISEGYVKSFVENISRGLVGRWVLRIQDVIHVVNFFMFRFYSKYSFLDLLRLSWLVLPLKD